MSVKNWEGKAWEVLCSNTGGGINGVRVETGVFVNIQISSVLVGSNGIPQGLELSDHNLEQCCNK